MRFLVLLTGILVYDSGDSHAFSFNVNSFPDNRLRFSRPVISVSCLGVKTSMNLNNPKKTKNKEQLNKSNKVTDLAKTSKPSIEKQYQYVQGGFNEVLPPTAENKSTTSMYAAFDSALRASSYNMFCSPLMPVEPPTPFRTKQKQNFRSSEPLFTEPKMDETSKLIEQYQELDRYLSQTSGRSDKKSKNVSHEIADSRMEGRLRVSDELIASARTVEASEKDYESLQNLLGFERMGTHGTSRMLSASIKGNMTKHRLVSLFCCLLCCSL